MRRKRLIAVLLCAEIVLSFAGCSKKKESVSEAKLSKNTQTTVSEESSDQKDPSDTSAKAPSDSTSESTAAPTATPLPSATPIPSVTPRAASYFGEFQPYVISDVMKDYLGEEIVQDYYNFCEAVLAEKDSFPCHSFEGYSDAYYLLSRSFFPYGYDAVCCPEESDFKDGMAKIRYEETKEWRQQHYNELKEATEKIVSEVFREEYSDFEKMIALYQYFANNYVYDYDMNHVIDGYREVYLPLMKKTGVCNEFSGAYAFLLHQVGVEVDFANGNINEGSIGHRWNIVRLDGEYYFVDTTWALSSKSLRYFLMDTDQRTQNGTEFSEGIDYTDAPVYDENNLQITSRKYSELWDALSFEVDYDHDLIRYSVLNDEGKVVEKEFHY